MFPDNHSLYFASLTVAQFKAFKKAFSILLNAGFDYDDAIDTLVKMAQKKRQRAEERTVTVKSVKAAY